MNQEQSQATDKRQWQVPVLVDLSTFEITLGKGPPNPSEFHCSNDIAESNFFYFPTTSGDPLPAVCNID